MKVNQKYVNNFIKIPNGLITSVSEYNDYVLTLYSFIGFNKNIMGQVVTNIDTLKEYFVKNENNKKDYTYSRDKKIIEALMILVNGTHVKDELMSDALINVKFPYGMRDKFSLYSEFGEIRLDTVVEENEDDINSVNRVNKESLECVSKNVYDMIEDECSFNDFSKYNLTIDINEELLDGNFTKFYVWEYCKLYNMYKQCVNEGNGNGNGNGSLKKVKFCHLINMYLYIKSVISRHASLNKKFSGGWKNKEYVTYADLMKRYNNYKAFVDMYLNVLEGKKMIRLNNVKDENGKVSKKNMIITLTDDSNGNSTDDNTNIYKKGVKTDE